MTLTRITFKEEHRDAVLAGRMQAVIVRDVTEGEMATVYDVEVKVGGKRLGMAGITDVTPVKFFSNGLAKLGNAPMRPWVNLRPMIRGLGLDLNDLANAIKPLPLDGLVVWFELYPESVEEREMG